MFLGYSLKSKAYKCFNFRTKKIVECTNVRIGENFRTKEKMVVIIQMKKKIILELLDKILKFSLRLTMIYKMLC